MPGKTTAASTKSTKRDAAKDANPPLLSGGNPQIAKGDGDVPVQAYIAAMPGWKSDLGRRLDFVIERTVPGVRKAVKWNSPFYGVEGDGWFLSFHCFTKYVKVAFFKGGHCNLFLRASPSRRTCVTSTSMRATRSTRRNSPTGSGKPANCRANACDLKHRGPQGARSWRHIEREE